MKRQSLTYLISILAYVSTHAQPVINSFTPESAPIGTQVTILGSNFDTTPEDNIVYFGGVRATVLQAFDSELTVEVPAGASYGRISVLAGGLTAYSSKPFLVTFESDGTISNSPATFDDVLSFEAPGYLYSVAPTDFDNDGRVDLLIGNYDDTDFSLYLNSSTGIGNIEFLDPYTLDFGNSANEFVIADFNNDGKPDFAEGGSLGTGGMVSVWENNIGGSGLYSFDVREMRTPLTYEVTSIASGDFNLDGKVDLVYANGGANTVTVMENISDEVIDMTAGTDYTVGNNPSTVAVSDMDNDGLPDLIVLNLDDNSISFIKNISSGGTITFAPKVDFAINSSEDSEWMTIGDLNDDGLPDMVVRNITSISVFENNSTSDFSVATPTEITTTSSAGIIKLDDFNGDARPDVLITGSNTLGVLENTSDATSIQFGPLAEFSTSAIYYTGTATSADLDGDGESDLVTTSSYDFLGEYYIQVFRNRYSGTDFDSFSFEEQFGEAVIDATKHTVDIEVVGVSDLTSLVSSFESSFGSSITIDGVDQTSGATTNDFTNPVIYRITAEDGTTTQEWTVNVSLGCPTDEVSKSITVCGSYEFDSQLLTSSGTYTGIFTNMAGCDSTVTLDLVVHETEFTHHVYSETDYDFNGEILTKSGQYTDALVSTITGCDSLVTLNLTIVSPDASYSFFELMMPEGTPQLNADFANLGGLIASGDLDGDGDSDVIVSGLSNNTGEFSFSVGFETVLYRNDGNGNFLRDESLLAEKSAHIQIADFDQDNDLDVLLVGSSLSSDYAVSLLLNDGLGHFTSMDTHGLPGFRAGSIRVVDLDKQNGPDLIIQGVMEEGTEDIYMAKVFYNQGNAEFTAYDQTTFTGLWGGYSDADDMDNDGDLDIIMTGRDESNAPHLFVYLNNDGLYQSSSASGISISELDGRELVQFIDVDHNHAPDVIIGKHFFVNDGTGFYTLQSTGLADAIVRPWAIADGDINGDGWTDLMISGTDSNNTSFEAITHLLLGDASGNMTFSQEVEGVIGGAILVDITGDSILDLLTSGYTSDSYQAEVEVFVNNGTGLMTMNQLEPIDQKFSDGDAHFFDFDDDGDQDLIVGGSNEDGDFKTLLYWNDGAGNFIEDTSNEFAESKYNLFIDDFNGDGNIDIITTYSDGNHLYLGDGLGTFSEKADANLGSNAEPYGAAADIDMDGDLDLVIVGSTNTKVLKNDGSGIFSQESDHPFINMYSSSVDFADVDGDSDLDLFIIGDPSPSSIPHQATVYLNDGTGNFSEDETNEFIGLSYPTANFVDVDGDGDADIFTSGDTGSQQTSHLYLNDGAGHYIQDASSEIIGAYLGDSEFSDLDDDGDLDLILTGHNRSDRTNYAKVYLNNGWGHFTEDTRAELIALNHSVIAIGDADGDGANDIFISGADNGKQTRLYGHGICQDYAEELVVEAIGAYDFYGQELRESGVYSHSVPLRCGKTKTINLDLTILPYVDPSEYADLAFELVQPASSPIIDLDLPKGTLGKNQIYDMDGDGDNDFFYFAIGPDGEYEYHSYINDGENHYKRVDQEEEFDYPLEMIFPIVRRGDLNGDGIVDLVIGGEESYSFSPIDLGTRVYFGDGDGQLHYQAHISLASSSYGDVRIEDFNNDGVADIFVIGFSGAHLYLNDGAGNLSEQTTTGMNNGLFLSKLAVSEPYNGGVDLVITDFDTDFTHVIYRFESGVFTEITRGFRDVEDYYHSIEFADANADGYPDFFILDGDETLLYLNDGTGNYGLDATNNFDGLETNYDFSLHFRDMNNDGAAEVLFGNNLNELAIFWNDGVGNFAAHELLDINDDIGGLTIGDINGDEYPDIVNNGVSGGASSGSEWTTRIYINDQANGFDPAQFNITTEFRDGDIAFLDANNDGHRDMIISGAYYEGTQSVTEYYLNDGMGSFSEISGHPFEGLEFASIAVGDFNGDHAQDVVLSGINQGNEVITKLYWSDGAGNFTLEGSSNFIGLLGEVVSFDANGDTSPDLLVIGENVSGSAQAELYLNDGAGHFSVHSSGLMGIVNTSVTIGDVDGDDDMDVLMIGNDDAGTQKSMLYFNDGAANFTETTDVYLEATGEGTVHMADLDGDGDLDIYLSGNGIHSIHENNGNGAFTQKHRLDGPFRSIADIGDIDMDGDLDIVESGNWKNVSEGPRTFIYFNDGNANFSKASVGALHGIFDGALALEDIDGDSDLDLMLSGGVHDPITSSSRLYRNMLYEITRARETAEACASYDFYGTLLTESGEYQHIQTDASGNQTVITLDLNILPSPPTDVTVSGITLSVEELSGVTYQWYSCDTDTPLVGETGGQLTPTANGNYYVEVFNGECTAQSECYEVVFPLGSNSVAEIGVFPNPVQDLVNIELPSTQASIHVQIFDLKGHLVVDRHFENLRNMVVSLEGKHGLYLLNLASEDFKKTMKIVKVASED